MFNNYSGDINEGEVGAAWGTRLRGSIDSCIHVKVLFIWYARVVNG